MDRQSMGGWEPDPRKSGDWRALFDGPRGGEVRQTPPPSRDDLDLDVDLSGAEYKPWLVQRGRSRPDMMIHLRRYEAKSGLWTGWMLPYPALHAVEYIGDRMVSLDFGTRQFVLEGLGLDGLVGPIQQGAVHSVLEFSAALWPQRPEGALISTIRRVGPHS